MNLILNAFLCTLVISVLNLVCATNLRRIYDKNKSVKLAENDQVLRKCGYEGCPKTDPNLINVHIVPHTHDDVGWLKTVDQYFYGSNSSIQRACVKCILDSVIGSLLDDPVRRFIYVESAFFFKWWRLQVPEMQEKVKTLVNEGRLEFIGGAWSMNDEATTHYQSIVDQFTWGLGRLNDTFGECGRPRVGWQIDPFGHSREMASLFAQMSFDGMFFGRLHYQDKDERMENKEMEFIWEASDNLGKRAHLFSGVLYNGYSPPPGFCFDVFCSDEQITNNKGSIYHNVDRKIQEFFDNARNVANAYKTNNILITMGMDFYYQDANRWFTNLDKLIKYGNEKKSNGSKFNLFYSTPSCYLKALHESNKKWPTKSDDFFPYASDPTAVWTGYFTSRPTVKGSERIGNQFLQICKQITSIAYLTHTNTKLTSRVKRKMNNHLKFLREKMGVMQHHDAVTGTEKQHVTDDYMKSLFIGIKGCSHNIKVVLNAMTLPSPDKDDTINEKDTNIKTHYVVDSTNRKAWNITFDFDSCLLLNISSCPITDSYDKFMVTVYNPLAHSTFQFVRFPVPTPNIRIMDYGKDPVQFQVIPITDSIGRLPFRNSTSKFEVIFMAKNVPGLGFKNFYVGRVENNIKNEKIEVKFERESKIVSKWKTPTDEVIKIGNDRVKLAFNRSSGLLQEITVDKETSPLTQTFHYYKGDGYRSSGAYIFRPKSAEHSISDNVQISVVRGDVVDEVYQIFNEWVSQIVRIYHDNSSTVEFEWLVGPIPVSDSMGKEIVTRFSSSIQSNGIFYTDSNGREMIKRTRNNESLYEQELVAINYYPITTKINLEDDSNRMAILTDRAQGGSSLIDGALDLMVHRRLLMDDGFGVGEALNEQQFGDGLIARGKHYLVFGSKKKSSPSVAAIERFVQNQKLMSNWFFFSKIEDMSYDQWHNRFININFPLSIDLPRNIFLMSLEPWGNRRYLVRFEHILENGEDPVYSKPVTINLKEVFKNLFHIESFRETNLAGNQWIENANRFVFNPEIRNGIKTKNREKKLGEQVEAVDVAGGSIEDDVKGYDITLNPMQMRTFVVTETILKSNTLF